MDIFIIALLLVLIILVITAIVLISRNKPVIDYSETNNSLALLDQKLDINSKQSGEAFRSISEQMHGLTEKNYEQMLKINESLNDNAEKIGRAHV